MKRNIFEYYTKDEMKELGVAMSEHEAWLKPKMDWLENKKREEDPGFNYYDLRVPSHWTFREWYPQKLREKKAQEKEREKKWREKEHLTRLAEDDDALF